MEGRYIQRLIRYCRIATPSSFADAAKSPSTAYQWDLQHVLEAELKQIGLTPFLSSECVLYCPINEQNTAERIVLITHVDVSPDAPGFGVNPQIVTRAGPEITLPNGIQIGSRQLDGVRMGDTVVTTDGTTLLGGDDKAGIACVMELAEHIMKLPSHERSRLPSIMLCFTPDEEICAGCRNVSVERLTGGIPNAFGVTLDGTRTKQITFETFNAWAFSISVKGFNIHPGHAYRVLVNAAQIAAHGVKMISDQFPSPAESRDREGYVLCNEVKAHIGEATLSGIIRSFDRSDGLEMIQRLDKIRLELQSRYPSAKIELTSRQQYENMREYLPDQLVERFEALSHKFDAHVVPFRGGTDGSMLSAMGLPTPNIWDGACCFHSVQEYVYVRESLEAIEFLKSLIGL